MSTEVCHDRHQAQYDLQSFFDGGSPPLCFFQLLTPTWEKIPSHKSSIVMPFKTSRDQNLVWFWFHFIAYPLFLRGFIFSQNEIRRDLFFCVPSVFRVWSLTLPFRGKNFDDSIPTTIRPASGLTHFFWRIKHSQDSSSSDSSSEMRFVFFSRCLLLPQICSFFDLKSVNVHVITDWLSSSPPIPCSRHSVLRTTCCTKTQTYFFSCHLYFLSFYCKYFVFLLRFVTNV